MSIQNNTNELNEILNMVNMLDGGGSDGSGGGGSSVAQNTFQYYKGTTNASSYNGSVTVNCGFQADLIVFYGTSMTQDGVTFGITGACPLDKKHYLTNVSMTGTAYYPTSNMNVYVYAEPQSNGFKLSYVIGEDENYYTGNLNYVAFKFNYVN